MTNTVAITLAGRLKPGDTYFRESEDGTWIGPLIFDLGSPVNSRTRVIAVLETDLWPSDTLIWIESGKDLGKPAEGFYRRAGSDCYRGLQGASCITQGCERDSIDDWEPAFALKQSTIDAILESHIPSSVQADINDQLRKQES